ncbi:MAG: guanylate kinase [Ignavibacteria bacterium]|nr:guanylate kinase [Ignavibacteria bacterium]MCU7503617.1 guanylate kinase [Ignavibacteria bacterium]MCU7516729.1 guanylate kinase [Ignavibacteria bacterium]
MTDNKGCIIVVSAPSGAGKTTIVKNVLKSFPEIIFSISATTRKKRESETNGVEYFFISEEEFLQKIRDDEFIEWEKFYDYYYGSLKSFVNENVEKGNCVLFEVDVKGALNIKKIYPGAAMIYIMPPSLEELKKRLSNRMTETKEDLKKRLDRAEMELGLKDEFDYIVINDELETAISEVKEIIKNKINKEEKI